MQLEKIDGIDFVGFCGKKNSSLPAIKYEKLFNLTLKNQCTLYENLSQMMYALEIPGKRNCDEVLYNFKLEDIFVSSRKTSMMNFKISFFEKNPRIFIYSEDQTSTLLHGRLKDGDSSLISLNASSDLSGTTLMLIWDKFCSLLYPGRVELIDVAEISCKHCLPQRKSKLFLRIWRILGDMRAPISHPLKISMNDVVEGSLPGSWYEKFGYHLEEPSSDYFKAVKYLSRIKIGDLEKIYHHDERNLAILQQCFVFALTDHQEIDKKDFPFFVVIRKIDESLKKDHIDERVHKLFHKIKNYIMNPARLNISRDDKDSEDDTWVVQKTSLFKFNNKTINTFEGFQSCLEIVDSNYEFEKIYN